jgi:hypothetical protein
MEMAIRVKSEKRILWKRWDDEPREERDMFMKSSVVVAIGVLRKRRQPCGTKRCVSVAAVSEVGIAVEGER